MGGEVLVHIAVKEAGCEGGGGRFNGSLRCWLFGLETGFSWHSQRLVVFRHEYSWQFHRLIVGGGGDFQSRARSWS